MKKTKAVVLGSVLVLSAVGCGATSNRDTRSSSATISPATSSATTSAAARSPNLVRREEENMTPENWREVKTFLSRKGFNPGSADSTVNDQTRQAITEFQRRNRFAATGLLDNQTLYEMQRDGAGFTGTLGSTLRRPEDDDAAQKR